MGYNQWSSRVKEEEKTLIDGAKQKSKSYGDFLSGLGPKDASNLSSQVDSMKEILKVQMTTRILSSSRLKAQEACQNNTTYSKKKLRMRKKQMMA